MKTKLIFLVMLMVCISCGTNNKPVSDTPTKNQVDYGSNPLVGKYLDINDIKLYYEVYGEGEPLLLLHGNSGSIKAGEYQIPELSKHFKVIAVDSRAQGRSTDSNKEITYALMASDMNELIDKLKLGSVYIVGWSDGGNIGLELAFAHPEKVRKLVTFGANYTYENFMAAPDSVVMDPNDSLIIKTSAFLQIYKAGFDRIPPEIKKKLTDLTQKYPNFTKELLKQIKIPVLIVVGDHDLITLDQTITMFTSLPHSQLFIVPGATHFVPIEQSKLINSEVIKFLNTPYKDINRYYWLKYFE
jgi:pimeloyl-ACP methyl ester carboxylesterase